DTSETNIISLAVDKQGSLYAGTDPGGIVMKFGTDGKPFGLLDSSLREVHDLAIAPDGSVYALVLGDTASTTKAAATETTPATPATDNKTVSVTKPVPGSDAPGKSRYDLKDVKSAVYRITPDGGNDLLWTSTSMIGF